MKLALEGIWGNAIGRDGKKLQPLNEEQRTTIPVTSEVVDEAIRVGMINGMAFRCNVEWEPHFKLFMHGIRTIYTDDIPIAYATLVHGIMQGILGSGKETCDDQMKKNVTVLLERETKAYEDFLKINRKQLK